jgi:hypothetical protein
MQKRPRYHFPVFNRFGQGKICCMMSDSGMQSDELSWHILSQPCYARHGLVLIVPRLGFIHVKNCSSVLDPFFEVYFVLIYLKIFTDFSSCGMSRQSLCFSGANGVSFMQTSCAHSSCYVPLFWLAFFSLQHSLSPCCSRDDVAC